MTLGHSIRSGVKWLVLGKVGNRLFEFAFGVILARLLVPADFGMIVTIQVFTGFVGMFTAGGMGQSLIRAKHADENDFTAVFTLQLAMGVLVYLGFYLAAPWIAHFFENSLYSDLIRVSALTFLLRPFLVMRNAWLNRAMNFKSRTMVEVISGLFTGATSAVMAFSGMGVWSLIVSGLLGSIFQLFWLARLTPLKLRLNPDVTIMRRHTAFGAKIVANDFVNYLRKESKSLVISKLAGPALLGLFNKAESLSRLPNQLLMSPTMEPLFRAMGKTQDDLDQTKYLFYRAVTLLVVYTTPLYVILWWIAEPFIGFVYGDNWIEAAAPMRILVLMGIFLNVMLPCSVVLAAQNRLGKEMFAQALNLPIVIVACVFGLQWGLEGVAWGFLVCQVLLTAHFYWYVRQALPTRTVDLVRAATPGLFLSALLCVFLILLDGLTGTWRQTMPALYLLAMAAAGGGFYAAIFLFLPIKALESEANRWRQQLVLGLATMRKILGMT